MRKLIYVSIAISLITFSLFTISEAKTYVLRDKLTGEPVGTASISDKHINDWAKDYILMDEGESYRGKQPHEIKYENGKLRPATKKEIDDYLEEQKQKREQADIERLLKLLEREDIKERIKKIKIQ